MSKQLLTNRDSRFPSIIAALLYAQGGTFTVSESLFDAVPQNFRLGMEVAEGNSKRATFYLFDQSEDYDPVEDGFEDPSEKEFDNPFAVLIAELNAFESDDEDYDDGDAYRDAGNFPQDME